MLTVGILSVKFRNYNVIDAVFIMNVKLFENGENDLVSAIFVDFDIFQSDNSIKYPIWQKS